MKLQTKSISLALLLATLTPTSAWAAPGIFGSELLASLLLFTIVALCFLSGFVLVRLLLKIEWAPLGVARAVLAEAIRMRAAAVFVALLLIGLSALPFLLDSEAPLHYQVQSFLSYALGGSTFMLSMLTVFLACGTLGFEQEDKRIQMVLVKPIPRGQYLLGKWIGIVLFNAVLTVVAGVAIFGSSHFLASQDSDGKRDRGRADEEVMVARLSVRPKPPPSFKNTVKLRLEALKREDPQKIRKLSLKVVQAEILEQELKRWRHIGANERETYIFENLNGAKLHGEFVQLRYKIRPSKKVASGKVIAGMEVNGRSMVLEAPFGAFQTLAIPVSVLDEKGRLSITIINRDPMGDSEDKKRIKTRRPSISFLGADELEVFYHAGTFAGNCCRGMLILWIKLGFLAMAGLFTSTFLSFPVAALCTFAFLVVASGSQSLLDSIKAYGADQASEQASSVAMFLRWTAMRLVGLLGQYGRFPIGSALADGRMITWGTVFSALLWIGFTWTGGTAILAWLIFRSREIARVQA